MLLKVVRLLVRGSIVSPCKWRLVWRSGGSLGETMWISLLGTVHVASGEAKEPMAGGFGGCAVWEVSLRDGLVKA